MPDDTATKRPCKLLIASLLPLFVSLPSCTGTDEGATGAVNPHQQYGITANNAFVYYADVEAATRFYIETLGLQLAADYGFAKILRIAPTSYLTLVDAQEGMHSADEPKTVAIALVTDQLDEWFDYLSTHNVEMLHGYNPVEGRPHHGFVALDPEGYYLEFERFNKHPENELLMPALDRTETVPASPPEAQGLGFKATILWLYYKDMDAVQRFYEKRLGLQLIVDQGWAKIYQTSGSGYIGLLDETRGMHSFTEQKAVTVSFLTDDLDGWFEHVSEQSAFELRSEEIEETERYRAFVGYDPEGYYLEFDTFLQHEDNESLLQALTSGR
jgi:catechol 2,3-dioxygenase-like lactoylglutathione lyase family enzyme